MSHLMKVVKRIDRSLAKKITSIEDRFSKLFGLLIVENVSFQKDSRGYEMFHRLLLRDILGVLVKSKDPDCAARSFLEASCLGGEQAPADRAIMSP
jgi:hypothetical protein